MSVSIKYKGSEIAALTASGTKTLKTAGKYCEGDITVQNTEGGAALPFEVIETVATDDGVISFTSTKRYNILLAKVENGRGMFAAIIDDDLGAARGLQISQGGIKQVEISATSVKKNGVTTYTYTWVVTGSSTLGYYKNDYELYGYAL